MIIQPQAVIIPAEVATSLQKIAGTEQQGDRDFQVQFQQAIGVLLALYDLLSPQQVALVKEALSENETQT